WRGPGRQGDGGRRLPRTGGRSPRNRRALGAYPQRKPVLHVAGLPALPRPGGGPAHPHRAHHHPPLSPGGDGAGPRGDPTPPGGKGDGSSHLTPLTLWSLERSEEHTSELQSRENLVCRLLLEKKKKR